MVSKAKVVDPTAQKFQEYVRHSCHLLQCARLPLVQSLILWKVSCPIASEIKVKAAYHVIRQYTGPHEEGIKHFQVSVCELQCTPSSHIHVKPSWSAQVKAYPIHLTQPVGILKFQTRHWLGVHYISVVLTLLPSDDWVNSLEALPIKEIQYIQRYIFIYTESKAALYIELCHLTVSSLRLIQPNLGNTTAYFFFADRNFKSHDWFSNAMSLLGISVKFTNGRVVKLPTLKTTDSHLFAERKLQRQRGNEKGRVIC